MWGATARAVAPASRARRVMAEVVLAREKVMGRDYGATLTARRLRRTIRSPPLRSGQRARERSLHASEHPPPPHAAGARHHRRPRRLRRILRSPHPACRPPLRLPPATSTRRLPTWA